MKQTGTILPHSVAPRPVPLPALQAYALWAESYDAGPNPILALQERVLGPQLLAEPSEYVVDIGCGTGRWLAKLLASKERCGVGIDFSREMLTTAAAKPQLHGRLVAAKCVALPFGPRIADLVVCSLFVGHLREVASLAAEVARIARAGARVFVSDFHPASYARGWRRSFRHAGELYEVECVEHPLEDLCETFSAHGLALESRLEPCFGEPERPIFQQLGKAAEFADLARFPALYVCAFRMTRPS